MTQTIQPDSIQKLVSVLRSLPSISVLQSKHDIHDYWSILFSVRENPSGWNSMRILARAVTPPDGEYPKVELRCLTVAPHGQLVFTISPAVRGADPREVAMRIEAQVQIRFRRFGQGVLN